MNNTFQELTGLQYIQCEITCKRDKAFEKKTWNERIDFFETLDLKDENMYEDASNPIGLRAAIIAHQDAINREETGYMISLDATSSGLQLLSLLVSCPVSFNLCGGDSSNCNSAYKVIYDAMDIGEQLTQETVKDAIMTSLYGSISTPEEVFKDDIDLFYVAMETMVPGAWDLNIGLQELWNDVQGSTYEWVMPDNFHCYIETKEKQKIIFNFFGEDHTIIQEIEGKPKFHKGLAPNVIHSVDGLIVREMFRRCMFNKNKLIEIINNLESKEVTQTDEVILLWSQYKMTGFLSVRILDYLNKHNMGIVDSLVIAKLIASLPKEPFDIVSIHDSFKSHANYGNDLRKQYNICLADINDSNLLESIASQIVIGKVPINKAGIIPRERILNSNYSLC